MAAQAAANTIEVPFFANSPDVNVEAGRTILDQLKRLLVTGGGVAGPQQDRPPLEWQESGGTIVCRVTPDYRAGFTQSQKQNWSAVTHRLRQGGWSAPLKKPSENSGIYLFYFKHLGRTPDGQDNASWYDQNAKWYFYVGKASGGILARQQPRYFGGPEVGLSLYISEVVERHPRVEVHMEWIETRREAAAFAESLFLMNLRFPYNTDDQPDLLKWYPRPMEALSDALLAKLQKYFPDRVFTGGSHRDSSDARTTFKNEIIWVQRELSAFARDVAVPFKKLTTNKAYTEKRAKDDRSKTNIALRRVWEKYFRAAQPLVDNIRMHSDAFSKGSAAVNWIARIDKAKTFADAVRMFFKGHAFTGKLAAKFNKSGLQQFVDDCRPLRDEVLKFDHSGTPTKPKLVDWVDLDPSCKKQLEL